MPEHYGYCTPDAVSAAHRSEFIFLDNGDIAVKRASLMWTNFEGAPTRYNPSGGRRTFNLVLTPDVATTLADRGWNVKYREPRDEGDEPLIFTEVIVNLESTRPPMIHICTEFGGKKNRMLADEDTVNTLDRKRYSSIDVVVHPYEHGRDVSSGTTIKGYLRSMNMVVENDDYFASDYADYVEDDEEIPFE